jgi:hypothetical protein
MLMGCNIFSYFTWQKIRHDIIIFFMMIIEPLLFGMYLRNTKRFLRRISVRFFCILVIKRRWNAKKYEYIVCVISRENFKLIDFSMTHSIRGFLKIIILMVPSQVEFVSVSDVYPAEPGLSWEQRVVVYAHLILPFIDT